MRLAKRSLAWGLIILWPLVASAANLNAADAGSHIGETATVCGTVASSDYAARSGGQPTFLNLDKPHPNQVFTIVIWGSDREKFGEPEITLTGKQICATGVIRLFRGSPEMVLHEGSQLIQK